MTQPSKGPKATPETNPMAKFAEKPTRVNAIKAMCAHCMGCTYKETEPGFRALIRECVSTGCPLHKFRPYQRAVVRYAREAGE